MSTKEHVITYLNGKLKELSNTVNSQWYVGIASDVRERLFIDHKVHEQNGQWAHSPADTADIARSVEKHFLDAGLDGGAGGGDDTTKTVYVYLKSSRTDP